MTWEDIKRAAQSVFGKGEDRGEPVNADPKQLYWVQLSLGELIALQDLHDQWGESQERYREYEREKAAEIESGPAQDYPAIEP